MIELIAIDRFASQVSKSQRGFILALEGLFHGLKTKNASAVAEFKTKAFSLLGTHLEDLKRITDQTLPVIAFLAGEESQHKAPGDYLLDAMGIQSAQSIVLFTNVLRRIHFDRRLGQAALTRGVVVKQVDKIGRRGDPERYAYLSARKTALDTFNDTKFVSNEKQGIESRVRHDDENHRFNGALITRNPQGDSTTYESARVEIFHPQSRAVLD